MWSKSKPKQSVGNFPTCCFQVYPQDISSSILLARLAVQRYFGSFSRSRSSLWLPCAFEMTLFRLQRYLEGLTRSPHPFFSPQGDDAQLSLEGHNLKADMLQSGVWQAERWTGKEANSPIAPGQQAIQACFTPRICTVPPGGCSACTFYDSTVSDVGSNPALFSACHETPWLSFSTRDHSQDRLHWRAARSERSDVF